MLSHVTLPNKLVKTKTTRFLEVQESELRRKSDKTNQSIENLDLTNESLCKDKYLDQYAYTDLISNAQAFLNNGGYNIALENGEIKVGDKVFDKHLKLWTKKVNEKEFTSIKIPYFSVKHLLRHLGYGNEEGESIIYATTLYKHTKTIVIDIDKRSNEHFSNKAYYRKVYESLSYFVKDLNAIRLIESNGENYHISIEYNQYYDKVFWSNVEAIVKSRYGLVLEIKSKGDQIRFPLSANYNTYGVVKTDLSPESIENFNDFIDADAFQSDDRKSEALKVLSGQYSYQASPPTHFSFIGGDKVEVFVNSALESGNHHPLFAKEEKREFLNKIKRQGDINLYNNAKFHYGRGTRNETQFKIALAFYRQHQTKDYEEFHQLCRHYNDGTSKDMRCGYALQRKLTDSILDAVADFCEANQEEEKTSANIDDSKRYTELKGDFDDIYSFTTEEYNKLEHILNITYTEFKHGKSMKVRKRRIEDAIMLFGILIKAHRFRTLNNYYYYNEEHYHLNGSVPFGTKLINTIQEELHLKNTRKLLDIIEDSGLISKVRNKEGYTYSRIGKRYTNHYRIHYNLFSQEFLFEGDWKFQNKLKKEMKNKVADIITTYTTSNHIPNPITSSTKHPPPLVPSIFTKSRKNGKIFSKILSTSLSIFQEQKDYILYNSKFKKFPGMCFSPDSNNNVLTFLVETFSTKEFSKDSKLIFDLIYKFKFHRTLNRVIFCDLLEEMFEN